MTPRTTFVGGINPFAHTSEALKHSKLPKGVRITAPQKSIPAKSDKNKTRLKDEDYSTAYQPLVAIVKECLTVATPSSAWADELAGIVIEDGVPLPHTDKAGMAFELLKRLKPRQSVLLGMDHYATVAKAKNRAHKEGFGKYTTKTYPDTQTVRLWRVA